MLPSALILLGLGVAAVTAKPNFNANYYEGSNYQQMTNKTRTRIFCFINGTRVLKSEYAYNSDNGFKRESGFNLQGMRLELCTHIVYAATFLNPNGWTMTPIDPELENKYGNGGGGNKISFEDIAELKSRKRDLQVLISVSGNSKDFSNMAKYHAAEFVQNAKTFLSKHRFDGLHIDWRYPTRRGGEASDKQNFSKLMKELKNNIRGEGRFLTASISHIRQNVVEGYAYEDGDLMDSVDFWFIMAIDYYGLYSPTIGAVAPIRSHERFSVETTIDDIKELFHKNSYKLALVIPFYGKNFQLRQKLDKMDESPMNKPFSNVHSQMDNQTYRDICKKINSEREWKRGWDFEAKVPYAVKETLAIVYEDAESVAAKTDLAIKKGLSGVVAYSIEMDDFNGDCGDRYRYGENYNNQYGYSSQDRSASKFPLLQAMYDTVVKGTNSAGLHSSPLALILAIAVAKLLKVYG